MNDVWAAADLIDVSPADLYSKEEGIFMWYLAFTLAMKCRVAGRRAFYVIRSLITFNGIFMAPGFDLGKGSLWRFHIQNI